MPTFSEEQLRDMIEDLKLAAANFTLKLNSAKLDVGQSHSNKSAFVRFETLATTLNRKMMGLEESGKERQSRRWRLHPEVFDRDVLVDLEMSRVLKAELDYLIQDLDGFKARAIRQESINRMGMSSLEMLSIVSTPPGGGTGATNSRKKKASKVQKTVHVREHYRRPPQRKPKSKSTKKN